MEISESGLALIKSFEGLKLQAYKDGGGKLTIGYGSTTNVKPTDTISETIANIRLVDDLHWAECAIAKLVRVPLTQSQFDALVSFVFNVGEESFKISTMLGYINFKRFAEAANEFPKWCHVNGEVSPGLLRRRQAERALFVSIEKEGA